MAETTCFYSCYNLPCNIMTSFKSIKVEYTVRLQRFRHWNPVNFICYSVKGCSRVELRPAELRWSIPWFLIIHHNQGHASTSISPIHSQNTFLRFGRICKGFKKLKVKKSLVMFEIPIAICKKKKYIYIKKKKARRNPNNWN